MNLPEPFCKQMHELLGNSYSDFMDSLQTPSPVSIRLNPKKRMNDFTLQQEQQIPWCKDGYYLSERPVFTLDPYFHAGHYYVQEPASMFLEFTLDYLKPNKSSRVLDLCSAPGGKATILHSYFSDTSIIHCHEYNSQRAQILSQNIHRWGCSNSFISQGPVEHLQHIPFQYDLILIDAPCSGEGMFRKEPDALIQWNSKKIKACTVIQQNLLQIADKLCAPGGYIIYSTCTYNRDENENQLIKFVQNQSYTSIPIQNSYAQESICNKVYAYRFFPHLLKTEGLCLSVIQKQSGQTIEPPTLFHTTLFKKQIQNDLLVKWIQNPTNFQLYRKHEMYIAIPAKSESWFLQHQAAIRSINAGISIGHFKGPDFYPEHSLALNNDINQSIETYSLNKIEAQNFLRSTFAPTPSSHSTKWVLATYQSAHLGWLKLTGNGFKNYLPKPLRIKNL